MSKGSTDPKTAEVLQGTLDLMVLKTLAVFVSKLKSLIGGRTSNRDLDQDVQTHLSLLTEKFVREGMTPEDARDAARRQFGNVTALAETQSEMAGFATLAACGRDLRHGARLLVRTPGWTLVAVLTLTIGIGANIAIFGLVRPVLLEPLPYANAHRIVVPTTIFERLNDDRGSVAFADIMDWKAQTDLFDAVAACVESTADITDGGEPERVRALFADDEYFRVMGARPLYGRFFRPEDNLPKAPPVVVLGHSLWMRRFAGSADAIGRRVEIRGVHHDVIGIAPRDSTWPAEAELFLPLGTGGVPTADLLRRDNHMYQSIARLKAGVSIEQAQAKLTPMAVQIAKRDTNRAGTNWKLHSLAAYMVGPRLQQTLVVLAGTALMVLLIACVNVTNLLLARGAARQHEIAVRAALGAGRKRIALQFLTEGALLSLVGGICGLVFGSTLLKTLVRFAPTDIPRLEQAHIGVAVLAFSLALCVLTTLVAGLVPALVATRTAPARSVREADRNSSSGAAAARLRTLLVVAELALAIVLLAGAGLLVRSFQRMQSVEPGIDVTNVLTLRLSLPQIHYAGPPQIVGGFDSIEAAIRNVHGVASASATSSLPLGGGGFYLGRVFLREGQPEPPATTDTRGSWCVVRPGYFAAMRIPLVEGRDITDRDTSESAPVIVISRSMAKQMFPDGHPIGRRIRSWRDENLYREIVGVVGDIRYSGLTDDVTNVVYVPHTQNSWRSLTFVVRSTGDPNGLRRSIRDAVWSVDKKLPVADVRTLDEVMAENMARARFSMLLVALFGVTAVVLATIGIYGVIAYAVTQRSRELGIRMALGAARTRVVGMVAWHALRLALAGVACGLIGAFGLTRLLTSLLFEVSPTDARTFGAVPVLVLLVASAAACIPARRASRVDPVAALRCE